MSNMRPTPWVLAFLALAGASALARDEPAAGPRGAEAFATVNGEFLAARNAYIGEMRAAEAEAKKDGGQKDFHFDKPPPRLVFSPRFLAVAEKSPEGPDAIEALIMTLRTSHGESADKPLETRGKALKLLRDHHLTRPEIKKTLDLLANFAQPDSDAFVRDVAAKNPDRNIQAAAYRALIGAREASVDLIGNWTKDEKKRQEIEGRIGKERFAQFVAKADRCAKELVPLRKDLKDKFGDLVIDLSVGQPAPEVVSRDVEGKTTHLSDHKGKVVVLDIWATWCPPCRAMIPHEREMVERLKDKPFALVSISVDEKLKSLTDFLAKEPMPWTHWWVGIESKFGEDWDIRHYPTIFVLDGAGVIRYKEICGEELEKAVNALLKEMDAKKTAAK